MNKVFLDGYIANEPQTSVTGSGKKRSTFNIAQRLSQEKTQFVHVQCWDKTAEYAESWCHKGEFVVAEGRVSVYEKTDQTGRKTSQIQIIVDRLERIKTRNSQATPQNASQEPQNRPTTQMDIPDDQLPF